MDVELEVVDVGRVVVEAAPAAGTVEGARESEQQRGMTISLGLLRAKGRGAPKSSATRVKYLVWIYVLLIAT